MSEQGGAPPAGAGGDVNVFELVGGLPWFTALVERFYEGVAVDPVLRPMYPDDLTESVAHTAGFTGLGVGASRFAAEVMLDRLAGLDTERTRLAMVRRLPLPFPPEPIASIGIQTTRWALDRADHRQGRRNVWLRSLDRLGLGFDS